MDDIGDWLPVGLLVAALLALSVAVEPGAFLGHATAIIHAFFGAMSAALVLASVAITAREDRS